MNVTCKLYVGAMLTTGTRRDHAKLYVFDPANNTWDDLDTPVYYFSMTTYNNDLVIINGRQFIDIDNSGPLTDKVLSFKCQWQPVQGIPAMNTRRCATSAVSFRHYLVVGGGYIDSGMSDIVEIFNGQQWAFASHLPQCSVEMKSIVHNGNWYLLGGRNQGRNVYYVALQSLISEVEYESNGDTSIWKKLPRLPYERSSPAVFGERVMAIGGVNDWKDKPISTTAIYAYCPNSKSWIRVGDLPHRLHSSCVIVLPTGELMVVGGMDGFTERLKGVIKMSLCGKSEFLINLLYLLIKVKTVESL